MQTKMLSTVTWSPLWKLTSLLISHLPFLGPSLSYDRLPSAYHSPFTFVRILYLSLTLSCFLYLSSLLPSFIPPSPLTPSHRSPLLPSIPHYQHPLTNTLSHPSIPLPTLPSFSFLSSFRRTLRSASPSSRPSPTHSYSKTSNSHHPKPKHLLKWYVRVPSIRLHCTVVDKLLIMLIDL